MEYIIVQLMAKENSRKEAARQINLEERASQYETNHLAVLDEQERQRRNRRKQPLQQYLPYYEDVKKF